MADTNQLFYYILAYFPLVFWIAYRFGLKNDIQRLDNLLLKQIELDNETYTLKKFFFVWLYVNILFYLTVGALGALMQIFVGFAESYNFSEKFFIIESVKVGFEISLLVSLLTFLRMSEIIKPNFHFAKQIYKTKTKPRDLIESLYSKFFLFHVLYIWLAFNLYYAIFGKFLALEGGKYLCMLYWFRFVSN